MRFSLALYSLFKQKIIGLSVILAILGIIVSITPTEAAERVILKYNILRESVLVSDLSDLANRGEVSPTLSLYLKLAQKKPEDLRQILTQTVDISPVLLSKILNSFPGEYLLDQVSEVIHTPSQRASRESLRGALVTSAVPDSNIRLIEVLENYPTDEVEVEGDRLADLYQQIKGVIGQIPRFPF